MSTSPRPTPSSTLPPGAERRAHARHAVVQDQIVAIGFQDDNGGLILDVSQHGCSVQTVGPLESGKVTEFDFVLPSTGNRLRGRAQVRWAERSGRAGLRFLEFSRGSLADLTAWLATPAAPAAALPQPSAPPAPPEMEPSEMETAILGATPEDALAFIATRTRDLTHASGVAIASGTAEEMICRASVGAAPCLGARLQANSSLSGECVRSRVLVRCDDTETDPRVDAALCRQLDLRSALLVPVLRADEIIGVLEVFSNVPRAFGSMDIQRLTRIAELIRSVLVGAAEPVEAGPVTPPAAAEPATVKSDEVAAIDDAPLPAVAPAIVETKAAHAAKSSSAQAAPPASVPRVIPRQSVRPRKLTRAERAALQTARPVAAPATPGFASASTAIPRAAKIGFAGACVIMLIAGVIFLRPRPSPKGSVQPPVAAAPASTPAAPPVVTSAPAPAEPVAAPKIQTKPDPWKGSGQKIEESVSADRVSLAQIRRPAQTPTEDAPAPPALAISSNVPNLVAGRQTPPSPSPRTSTVVVPGKLLRRVAPQYPQPAYSAHISGDVVLNAVIRQDGTIGTIEVVSGNPMLARAAVEAVRQWRYEPYRLNGEPVEAVANVRLTFKPK